MKKKYIFAALVLMMGLASCDNLLDLTPQSQISQTDYFKTESDLQLFSNTFYNNLLDKSPFDDQSDLYVQQTLSNEIIGGNNRTVPASGGGWTWTDLRKMNTLLAYAHQCNDDAAVIKYTALTRFFRAFFYFEKVKRFGDVPWYETELGSAAPELYKARDSRELVMGKMLEDIDYAIENLPGKSEEASSPFRVNRYAAMALKTQFCLYEGTFRKYHGLTLEGNDYAYYLQQAADAAKQLMQTGEYKLYSTGNPEMDYLNLFAAEDANTDEYIFAIKFDYSLAIHHNANGHTLVPTQGRPGLTRKMVNTYLMKDGSRFTDQSGWQEMTFLEETKNRDPRLAQSIRTPGYTRIGESTVLAPDLSVSVTGYQPIKFVQEPTASGGQVDRNSRNTNDLPVFRYAEVLLNYAEAMVNAFGDPDYKDAVYPMTAREAVNKVRARGKVEMPPYPAGMAKDDFIERLKNERRVELAFEGHRFWDVRRWKDLDKTADIYGVKVIKNGEGKYEYTKFLMEKRTITDNLYFYPISNTEKNKNPNLGQNPGW